MCNTILAPIFLLTIMITEKEIEENYVQIVSSQEWLKM